MITFEWSDWRNKNIWWIQSVYVNKKNRKKGVFKQMVAYIKDEAKKNNVDTLRLYVYESNINAIKSYKKIGMTLEPYYIFKLNLK
jgi:GNAT superfamily N-acetyltransferase